MKITWLGTASLLIESDGHKLLFDPYLRKENKRLPPFPVEEVKGVEAIFVSHPHFDHYADVSEIMKFTHCPVYTNARGIELAKEMCFDLSRIKLIDFKSEFMFGNLTLNVYQGRHIAYDKAAFRGAVMRSIFGHPIKGLRLQRLNKRFAIDLNNDVFAFRLCEGEKSLLILGSANVDEQAKDIPADILVYPYQGRSDMLEYSLKLVKSLSPESVILDHFDDAFPPVSTSMNVEEFKKALEGESSIKVIIPAENEQIEF